MSTPASETPAEGKPAETPTPQAQETPAQEIDWKTEARKWEERAKKNTGTTKQVQDLEARLKQYEDANKSETEKLTDRAAKAEQSSSEWRGKYEGLLKKQAVLDAATTAGTIDAETVFLHVQAAGGVDVDDEGNVTGADKAVAAIAKSKPHLFRTTPEGARDHNHNSPAPPALNSDALTDALARAVGA